MVFDPVPPIKLGSTNVILSLTCTSALVRNLNVTKVAWLGLTVVGSRSSLMLRTGAEMAGELGIVSARMLTEVLPIDTSAVLAARLAV
jgi:hypothetical protein